jgi:beta-glucanase (GH16 family)
LQFRNDSQEIDVEFLSKQFEASSGAVNLVLQNPLSVRAGFDAQGTPDYALQTLPFDPSAGFHEYRFDWTPTRVSFYVDGAWQHDMVDFLPTNPGHIVLNHWSNGDQNWSAGPPQQDAVMTISYVKAYFNSSDSVRKSQLEAACPDPSASGSICLIPDQTVAPDPSGPNGNETAKTYFFTKDPGHAPNQIASSSATSFKSYATALNGSWLFGAVLTSLILMPGYLW